jgi:lysozyme
MIVDVAYHEGIIDWPKAKAAGVTEAYIRLGTGARWGLGDPLVLANVIGAIAAGVPFAPYVVPALTEGDMKYQAQCFVANIQAIARIGWTYDPKRKPAGDWERYQLVSRKMNRQGILTWTGTVSQALSFMPATYTSAGWWNDWVVDAGIEDMSDLWVANYTTRPQPQIPTAWTKRGRTWYLWQYTDKGTVAGISGGVDLCRRPNV